VGYNYDTDKQSGTTSSYHPGLEPLRLASGIITTVKGIVYHRKSSKKKYSTKTQKLAQKIIKPLQCNEIAT